MGRRACGEPHPLCSGSVPSAVGLGEQGTWSQLNVGRGVPGAGHPHSPWADLMGWEGAGCTLKHKGLSPGLVEKEAKDMGAWHGPS